MNIFSLEKKIWKSFLSKISLVILLFIVGVFIGLFSRERHLIDREILKRAQTNFDNIILTRRWNAKYGGVYIEKKEGVESNPYLINPDIITIDGKRYTKKNPALMTREISVYAEQDSMFKFHITSTKPLNPGNTPDELEKNALLAFENGKKEYYTKVKDDETTVFWYMAPLFVEESCMNCHAIQGYKVGDVRGGISVQFDITEMEHSVATNMYLIIGLGILTIFIILVI